MLLQRLLLIIIAILTSVSLAYGQDGDNPTIAILRYGGTPGDTTFSEYGVLDMLEAHGLISTAEREQLSERRDLDGEHINVIWGDAGWDLATANLMIDDALGREADALITLTTPVTRAAVFATMDLDEPPVVLFASVFNPAEAGIAQDSCLKPAHVTGSVIEAPYARALEIVQTQIPDISVVGLLHTTSEISGLAGAGELADLATAQGLDIEQAAVNSLADFPAATASLVNKGAEAIVAPIDAVTAQALPVISSIANDNGIPFVYPILGSVLHGATFGVGFTGHYEQGLNLGILLAGWLDGEMDPATTAIAVHSGEGHSVNFDAAIAQDIVIAPELADTADLALSDGEVERSLRFLQAYSLYDPSELSIDESIAAHAEFLAGLHCSEDMIAQQQAELDG